MRYLIRSARLCALLFVAQMPHLAHAESAATEPWSGWRPYAELSLWEASDAVAVTKFESDWSTGVSPRDGRNATLLRHRAGIGMEKQGWSIGWEARQEASLIAGRETVELVRLYKQRLDPQADARFDVAARFTGWSAHGLRAAHGFDAPDIAGYRPRMHVSAAVYGKPSLRENRVAGSVTYDQAGSYGFNAAQTDANSRHHYPFMHHKPSAYGASLSVAMDWPLADALSLKLRFEDVWSRIKWTHLPVMQRTVNSEVADRDSEGFINYRPVLSGMNQQVGKSFSIPRSHSASLSYRSGGWGAALHIERWSDITIPALAMTRYFEWGKVTADLDTRFKTVGVGIAVGKLRLALQSDSLRPDHAKALGVHMRYSMTNE